jgi:hypothetical protein
MKIPDRFSFVLLVVRPNGKQEHVVVAEPRVLIGGGAHCDIRIDALDAPREHVELSLEADQVFARAITNLPAPYVDGVALVATRLEAGAQLDLCGTRIVVNVVGETKRAKPTAARRLATMAVLSFATLTVPAIVYAALGHREGDVVGRAPPPVELWDGERETCRAQASDQALFVARRERSIAEAKRERYPFAVEEGPAAVAAFERAASCHQVANRPDEAKRDIAAANALRVVVSRDYHAHRARLTHAIESEDLVSSLREVRIVRKMTTGRSGPYVEWLAVAERRLDLSVRAAIEKDKEKK